MSGRARAAAMVALVMVLAGCSGGQATGSSQTPAGVGPASTPREVAIQAADLPAGFEECGYSGDIEAYMGNIENVDPATFASVSSTWAKLKEAGAVAAYAAFYGDSKRACDNFILPVGQRNFGTEEQHVNDHPKIASSIVFQFPDEVRAEEAYKADHFGQSGLKDEIALDVAVGEASRLGPNSIAAASQGSPIQIRQAAWQRSRWNVLFRSAAIERPASEAVTTAMNIRMG